MQITFFLSFGRFKGGFIKSFSITVLRKRLLAFFVAVALIFFLIIARLFYVEVIWSRTLTEKAVDQWTRELPIKAVRGQILDGKGRILAATSEAYSVFIRPRCVTDRDKVASVLSGIFGLNKEDLLKKMSKNLSEITVKRRATRLEILKLKETDLDGVYYSLDGGRVYPYGSLLCQVLGFTNVDGAGTSGLEKLFDKYLKGIDGEFLYESDLTGKDLSGKSPSFVKATDGLNVVTNIDVDVQKIVESSLMRAVDKYSPKSASAVVMDPSTGKVLAMATLPSYDLNAIPRDDMDLLNALTRNPVVCDSYEPGSTFKIITSVANIEESLKGNPAAKGEGYVFPSSRYREVAGGRIKCWSDHKNGKHANQTLREALATSCNPCFTDLALSLGKETFYSYLTAFGFGKKTGIDFGGEASGLLIPVGAVKEGDLARIAFGQSIAVTPIQLAAAVCAAVNGGNYFSPQIVSHVEAPGGKTIEVFPQTVKKGIISKAASLKIASYLESVVSEGGGKAAYIEGYRVAGKTGTAQKFKDGAICQGKNVMSFIGFFPANAPKYLCLAIVDEPVGGIYGSTVAAPIVGEIFQKIIDLTGMEKTKDV